jgi:hypothetical protein
VVCKLDFDIRKISREDAKAQSVIQEKKRKNFAIWIKIGNKTKHYTIGIY